MKKNSPIVAALGSPVGHDYRLKRQNSDAPIVPRVSRRLRRRYLSAFPPPKENVGVTDASALGHTIPPPVGTRFSADVVTVAKQSCPRPTSIKQLRALLNDLYSYHKSLHDGAKRVYPMTLPHAVRREVCRCFSYGNRRPGNPMRPRHPSDAGLPCIAAPLSPSSPGPSACFLRPAATALDSSASTRKTAVQSAGSSFITRAPLNPGHSWISLGL